MKRAIEIGLQCKLKPKPQYLAVDISDGNTDGSHLLSANAVGRRQDVVAGDEGTAADVQAVVEDPDDVGHRVGWGYDSINNSASRHPASANSAWNFDPS